MEHSFGRIFSKKYLSLAVSSVLTGTFSFSAYAAPCEGYSVNVVCEQSKFGPTEFIDIVAGDGMTLGSEDHHFVINGDGYELYNPQAHYATSITSGTVKFTEVTNSRINVAGSRMTVNGVPVLYDGRAENTTLNDSLLWVMASADRTTAYGKSAVMVTTQFSNDGKTYVNTNPDNSVSFVPIVTNNRYYDNSTEMLWGIKNVDKNWDTLATSENSIFFNASEQQIKANGLSVEAIFNDATRQLVYAGGEARNTVLNDNAYAWAKVGGKLSGTTQANDNSMIYMDTSAIDGAVADKIILNGDNTTLIVRYSEEHDAFAVINQLDLSGGMVKFQNGADNYANLIVGSLSGSGVFNFNTTISQGKGNMLLMESGSGSHRVIINDSGEEITTAENQTLNIINDKSSGADFTLASLSGANITAVDGGAYMYSLKQKNGKDGITGNVWYLGADWQPSDEPAPDVDPEDVPPADVKPLAKQTTPSTDAVLSMASANQFIFDSELQNLRLRKGDLRNSVGDNFGAWGRYLTNNTRVSSSMGAAYKLQQDGFEIGGDKVIALASGKMLLGGFTAYSNNKLKHARGGNSDIDSYSLGIYATYFDDSGYYIDGVLKANRFSNSLNARSTSGDIAKSNYHQNAIGTSVEAGYNYQFSQDMYIEPYLRASYFSAESKNITLNNGMKADIDNNRSAKAEVGFNLGKAFDLSGGIKLNPYVKAAIEREFIKSNHVRINQRYDFNNDFSGNIGKYGLGLDARISERTALYMEVDYRKGHWVEMPVEANLGFRINF